MFKKYEETWGIHFKAALGQDIPESTADALSARREESTIVFAFLRPVTEACLELITGRQSPSAGLEAQLMFFLPKILRIQRLGDLNADDQEMVSDLMRNNFLLGLTTHLVLWSHDARVNVGKIDRNALFERWSKVAAIADTEMRDYDKHQQGIPRIIFESHFERELQPTLKGRFGIGVWKMGKASSHFRNQFFSGTLLGMQTDIAAEKA